MGRSCFYTMGKRDYADITIPFLRLKIGTGPIHSSDGSRRVNISRGCRQRIVKKAAVVLYDKWQSGVAVPFSGFWRKTASGVHKQRIGKRSFGLYCMADIQKLIPAPGIFRRSRNADTKGME